MHRQHVPIIFLITISIYGNVAEESAKKPPNIVFIFADDYGFHDIGYHGAEIQTPVLDELAAGGVKLENYYVQQLCTPSRTQLLTGRYDIHTGLQHLIILAAQPNCMPVDLPTLPAKLRELGYKTHIVGKWHLGFYKKECMPLNRGFDSHFGFLLGANHYYKHTRWGGYDLRDNFDVAWNNTEYSTLLFTRKAQEKIEAHDKDKPLFLYLPYQAVHRPLQVPKRYTEKYKFIKDWERRTYAGMVSAMDESIGKITDTLKTEGLWNNTILIFSADNGGVQPGNNYPLRGGKATLWEGGVHGIGFVASPLLARSGVVSHDMLHVSDWFPTILQLAGGNTDGLSLDGHNVWDTINQGSPSPRTEILHNIDPFMPLHGSARSNSPFDVRVNAALRVGDWKIITGDPGYSGWHPKPGTKKYSMEQLPEEDENVRLFNIKLDPEERTNVADRYPDVVDIMLKRLASYNATAVPVNFPPIDFDGFPKIGEAWGPWK